MWPRLGVIGGLIAVLTAAGCAVKVPITKKGEGFYPGAAVRAGVDYLDYDAKLTPKLERVGVPPGVQAPGEGVAQTNLDGDLEEFTYHLAPRLGLEGSIGTNNIRMVGGLDWAYNFLSQEDGDREGMYSLARQQTKEDIFAFTQLTPDAFTYIPFIGVEGRIGNFTAGAAAEFPLSGFDYRAGNQVNGAWETTRKDSWSGVGRGFSARIGWIGENNYGLSFVWRYEGYEPEFYKEKTDVKTNSFSLEAYLPVK